jgi:hypothetical protein
MSWIGIFAGTLWTRIVGTVGAAVVGVVAPLYVDWVRARRRARERAAEVSEQRCPENPAGLLRADRHVVPFTGRSDEYDQLREWCRDDNPPVQLVVGAGGVGKTRLALHLGDYLTSCGWSVTVVGAGQEADALKILRDATGRSSIFLVVDYAETRTSLLDLLRSVADNPARVRVLLIARSAGDWWRQLGSEAPAVRDLVQAYPPLTLSARVDSPRRSVLRRPPRLTSPCRARYPCWRCTRRLYLPYFAPRIAVRTPNSWWLISAY